MIQTLTKPDVQFVNSDICNIEGMLFSINGFFAILRSQNLILVRSIKFKHLIFELHENNRNRNSSSEEVT